MIAAIKLAVNQIKKIVTIACSQTCKPFAGIFQPIMKPVTKEILILQEQKILSKPAYLQQKICTPC